MKRNLTLLSLLALLLLTACDKYAKPGQTGQEPNFPPDTWNGGQQGIFYNENDGNIPDPIPCGISYGLTFKINEVNVDCADYNFANLYNQAFSHFDRLRSEWKCENDCDLQWYIVSQTGICNTTVAAIVIKFVIQCVKKGTPETTGLARKSVAELNQPFQEEMPPPTLAREESYLAQYMKPTSGCPVDFNYHVTIAEKVFSCNEVRNYRPYVDRAKAMAAWVSEHTDCPIDCRKQDPVDVALVWGCTGDKVQVDYWFKVPCKS